MSISAIDYHIFSKTLPKGKQNSISQKTITNVIDFIKYIKPEVDAYYGIDESGHVDESRDRLNEIEFRKIVMQKAKEYFKKS